MRTIALAVLAVLSCVAPQAGAVVVSPAVVKIGVRMPDARVGLDLSRPDIVNNLRGLSSSSVGRGLFLTLSGKIHPQSELGGAIQLMKEENVVSETRKGYSTKYRVSGDRVRDEDAVIPNSLFWESAGRIQDITAFGRRIDMTFQATPAQIKRITAELQRQGAVIRSRYAYP
jgi:hypothetical protein